jgi:hypothetical protein
MWQMTRGRSLVATGSLPRAAAAAPVQRQLAATHRAPHFGQT